MASSTSSFIVERWTDAIKIHPMFAHLSDGCCGNDGELPVCQSRGDLFVWDPSCQLMLTTNLKRLHATINSGKTRNDDSDNEEEIFDGFQVRLTSGSNTYP